MTTVPARSAADRLRLRRAALKLGAQTAAAMIAVVLVTAGSALVIDEHIENTAARRIVQSAWLTPGGASATRSDVWVVEAGADPRQELPRGAPASVRVIDPAALGNGFTALERNGKDIATWTGDQAGHRVSTAYLEPSEPDQARILKVLAFAALLGVVIAGMAGAVIGRRAVRPLMDAIALQRHFVADASHELRTPLTVLQLRAQMLLQEGGPQLSATMTDQLESLVRDAKSMAEVVNDLLESAQLEHQRDVGDPVDLRTVAQEVVISLQPIADQRLIRLSSADAPDQELRPVVIGALGAVRRAVLALTDNALEHTPVGGRVQVSVGWRGDNAVVSVQDDGEGLDAQQLQRLVGRFSRGSRDHQGRRFGLGLALVHEMAQSHGGRLEVTGEPGVGACFSLVLPADRPLITSATVSAVGTVSRVGAVHQPQVPGPPLNGPVTSDVIQPP